MGEELAEKGEARIETASINANVMKAENCIIILNPTAYVFFSRVDTVNCNAAVYRVYCTYPHLGGVFVPDNQVNASTGAPPSRVPCEKKKAYHF